MKLPYLDIKDFDYILPEEKIAKYPLEQRSLSKLLYYNKGLIEHKQFTELSHLLPAKSLLVFNNTKVIEARLKFQKETVLQQAQDDKKTEIEVFLLNPSQHENVTNILRAKGESVWQCMIGNKKRWKKNDSLTLIGKNCLLLAKWKDRENDIVQFTYSPNDSFEQILYEFGSLPIPPYLNRSTEEIDLTRYQTCFAEYKGSVATPTAALHFDEKIYEHLKQKNILSKYLTLHIGAGTFKPVSTENAIDHLMHEEYIVYSKDFIESLLKHEGPVVAVGTTSLRSLESLYWFGAKIFKTRGAPGVGLKKELLNHFHIEQYFPYQIEDENVSIEKSLTACLEWMQKKELETLEGTSSLYIVPGYTQKMTQGIITNFHQPKSTLLLLITALIGNDWKAIYQSALDNNYRFLSYGDSSLLLF